MRLSPGKLRLPERAPDHRIDVGRLRSGIGERLLGRVAGVGTEVIAAAQGDVVGLVGAGVGVPLGRIHVHDGDVVRGTAGEPCSAPAAIDRRRLGGSSHRGREAIQVAAISTRPAMKTPNSTSSTARAAPPLPARDATATARAMPATATVRAPTQRFGRPRYPASLACCSGIG